MARTRNEVRFGKFVELYDLYVSGDNSHGFKRWDDVYEAVPISRAVGSKWKIELDKLRKEANTDDCEEFRLHMRALAFGESEEKATSKDRELYARMNGWLVDKREETVKYELSADERLHIARETINRLKEIISGGGRCPVCGFGGVLCDESCLDTEPEYEPDNTVETLALPA
jgi:hypothetical protein